MPYVRLHLLVKTGKNNEDLKCIDGERPQFNLNNMAILNSVLNTFIYGSLLYDKGVDFRQIDKRGFFFSFFCVGPLVETLVPQTN